MTVGVWTRLASASLPGLGAMCPPLVSVFPLHPPCEPGDASPAQTPTHHLSLRPRRKVLGKLDTSRHSCLTSGPCFCLSGGSPPAWLSPGLLPTFPRQRGHSSPDLPASAPWPSLPQPHCSSLIWVRSLPCHREGFKVPSPCGLF